jgi:hypothetical protein
MQNDVISYREMCDREGIATLQRGMNYRVNSEHSVVLMSQRGNAPYEDAIDEEGEAIEYEGHDVSRGKAVTNPKKVDQPRTWPSGKLTQNGLFAKAVEEYKAGKRPPECVRVYEKLFPGIWVDRGMFQLVDYRLVESGGRRVFRFYLRYTGETAPERVAGDQELRISRTIPTEVKKEVWKRDKGRCTYPGCGRTDNLHFDHDIPFSKGGSSLTAANVRLLCARHNLQKRDRIE